MNFEDYKDIVNSDRLRYCADKHKTLEPFFKNPGLRYTFLIRTAKYLANKRGVLSIFYAITRILHESYYYRYGTRISLQTMIGPGLSLQEFERIKVCPEASIGRNCSISNGSFIGKTSGGKYPGAPVIKDNVSIGPDSKIVGGIQVGNNVSIGPKSVVTESVPDNLAVMTLPDFLGIQ